MHEDNASRYIRDEFEPDDRLAIVLIDRRSGSVIQRIAPAQQIASPEFQNWLHERNHVGADVFVSMNALHQQARGRTRADVAVVRHIYLDFDDHGTQAVERLQSRTDIPKPSYLVNTSRDHWQVTWKVQGFDKEQAEELMRGLVREFGADPAATDCARVLRVPGFVNHKRHPANLVRAEGRSTAVYSPDQFPRPEYEDRPTTIPYGAMPPRNAPSSPRTHLSQSEFDWAYAKRALARGDSPEMVATAIAEYPRGEKSNPDHYAARTVKKAAESLTASRAPSEGVEPER